MNISDINPFIRYASITGFRPFTGFGYANDYRMFYMISGKCRLDIEDKTYNLVPHSLALIPPGTKYKFTEFDGITIGVFNFDLDQSRSEMNRSYKISQFPQGTPVHFDDFDGLYSHIVFENFDKAEKYVVNMAEEFSMRKNFYRERISGLMKTLIFDILRYASTGEGSTEEKTEKILSYIADNLEKPLTGNVLGAVFGYHPYYISRLIKLHTGKSLKQYIILARMGEAKKLLKSTDLSLSEIASRCGFENAAYFSNAFKAKTKMSPGQYRKAKIEYI